MLPEYITAMLRNPEVPQHHIIDAIQELGGQVAKVWVVYGESGSYSDHTSWTVAAFLDKDQAYVFRDKLNKWCEDNFTLADRWGEEVDKRGIRNTIKGNYDCIKIEESLGDDPKCPFDPNFHMQYDGVSYDVWEMPLKGDW